jgi:isoleucyl-tRNA synthetase
VHQPPAQLGRAAALLPAQGHGRAAPAHDGDPGPGGRHRRAGGIEAWSRATTEEILGAADAPHYTKSSDILEVWFDSGSTFEHVLRGSTRRGLAPPEGPEADLYLEGHDQHRGWFHSSLLLGCALYDRAPYRGLLTHGFTVDSQGRKMSKSLGNGIEPQAVSQKLGAEIIRLWVAASDYSGDIAGDDKILARVVDAYRRIRNTLRFLLANTSATSTRARTPCRRTQMLEIDRWALARAAQFQAEVLAHYEVYEFHPVVAKLQVFCSEDLGAFYLDVLKDRLYTTAPKSLARRSAQTALWQITHAMLRWMAPFLSFTAEEAWGVRRQGLRRSSPRPTGPSPRPTTPRCWPSGRASARSATEVNKEIEAVRTGQVGSSLQATCCIAAAGRPRAARLAGRRPALRAHHLAGDAAGGRGELAVEVTPSAAPSANAAGTGATTSATTRRTRTICGRCTSNLHGAGEARRSPDGRRGSGKAGGAHGAWRCGWGWRWP